MARLYDATKVTLSAVSCIHKQDPDNFRDNTKKARKAFHPLQLIEDGIASAYQHYGDKMILEEDVDRILKKLESVGLGDPEFIKEQAFPYSIEVEQPIPIFFNNESEFIEYKRQNNNKPKKTSANTLSKEQIPKLFSLSEFKNKMVEKIHQDADEYDNNIQHHIDYVKTQLSAKTLVSKNIPFIFEEMDGKMMLTESAVDGFLENFKNNGIKSEESVKRRLNEFETETDQLTPVVFNDFNEFVEFKKQQNSDSLSLNKFIKKKKKEEKASQKQAKQSKHINQIMEKLDENSVFMAIDFECSYDNNHIPLEIGTCLFGAQDKKEAITGEHWIFEENAELLKNQPKKFKKQNHFNHGETTTKPSQAIADQLQEKVNQADFIVCHAAQLEKSMMRSLGVTFSESQIIDSQIMHKIINGNKQVSSIEKIARAHGEDESALHNAGNDAVFTAHYFLDIVHQKNPEIVNKNDAEVMNSIRQNRKMRQ